MPDITMCQQENCEKKLECFRYMAEPNPKWQSYVEFNEEFCGKNNNYKMLIRIRENDKLKNVKKE